MLSYNTNGIKLLKENKDKINWYNLSCNRNGVELLKENKDKIDWYSISRQSMIFKDEIMPFL